MNLNLNVTEIVTKIPPPEIPDFPADSLLAKSFLLQIILLLLLFVVGVWLESIRRGRFGFGVGIGLPKNIPPGPRSLLELVITLRSVLFAPELDIDVANKILEAQYGKVVGWFSYLVRTVLINGSDNLQSASKNPTLQGRPLANFLQLIDDGVHRGIATASGETWRELRRFTVIQLKSLGMGKKTRLDPIIAEQVEECVSILRTKIEQPFSSTHFFHIPTVNFLWEIISGQKFSLGDPEPQKLAVLIDRMSKSWVQGLLVGRYPKMGTLLLSILRIQNPFPDVRQHFKTFTSTLLKKRLKSRTQTDETHDDFTQTFIEKIQATTDLNSPFYGQLGYENFQEVIRDLFVAGSETTSNTISWALLYLALHPEKQQKLQREIDQVLGRRMPNLDDKSKMNYTAAVMNETLRKSSLLPFGLPHVATEDTTVAEFQIPKGTMVSENLYAIHHCQDTWGDPQIFRPERFLTEDETTLIKHEALVPFGFGKRICPGMALASDEIFMFITRIFQEFTITWNPEESKPNMKPRFGATLTPSPHTLIITQRTALLSK